MGVFGHLRQIAILQPVFSARDRLMKRLGLFKVKSSIKRRVSFIKWQIEDNRRRKSIARHISRLPDSFFQKEDSFDPTLTVSLTSYGKRVESSAPFAIYSILSQTVLPDRIVLNLDKTRWNKK